MLVMPALLWLPNTRFPSFKVVLDFGEMCIGIYSTREKLYNHFAFKNYLCDPGNVCLLCEIIHLKQPTVLCLMFCVNSQR